MLLPLAASLQAAIHLMYCCSCKGKDYLGSVEWVCMTERGETDGVAAQEQFGHALGGGNEQLDGELVLRKVHVRRHLAAWNKSKDRARPDTRSKVPKLGEKNF